MTSPHTPWHALSSSRRWTRLACAAIMLALALLALGSPAAAHGFLVRAVPDDRAVLARPPARVQYWFSESLEPAFSTISVRDATGTVIATGEASPESPTLLSAQLPPNLPDGAYIADLRLAFASDGHVIAETRVFFIGEEVPGVHGGVDAQADPVEVLWRTATAAGLIAAFGAAVLYGRVLLPAWGSAAHAAGGLPPRVIARLTLIGFGGIALAIAAQIAALLHQSVVFFGVPMSAVLSGSLWSVVRTSTRFGEVWNARMLVLIICAAMLAVAWLYRRSNPELTRPMWAASVWGLTIALGASSVISHAAGSRTAAWAALLLDWAHLLAAGIWAGGLAALVVVLPAALGPLDADGRRKAMLAALRRFSPIAAACLVVVVATGIFSATLWVRPSDIVGTGYGLALLIKLGLVACLVALGAAHYAALNPAAAEKRPWARLIADRYRMTAGRFLSTLRLEVVFAVLTIAAAGWLTASPVPVPPDALRAVAPLTASSDVSAGGQQSGSSDAAQPYLVSMTISPGGPGVNTFDLTVTRNGMPVDDLSIEMQAAQPARDVRSAWTRLEPTGGAYSTVTPDIDRAGEWWSLLNVGLPDGETLRAAFAWEIRADAAVEPSLPLNAIQAGAFAAALAGLGFAALPQARRIYRRLDLSPQAVTVALLATVGTAIALIAGAVIIDQQHARYEATVNPAPSIVNDVLPDAESLAQGAAQFAAACAEWLPETPGWRDLTTRLPRTRDEELFAFLRDGYRGLPACGDLPETQRWDVVNYLRAALRA